MVKQAFDLFVAVSDAYCIKAMRSFFTPGGDDPHITSGESGAAGLAALIALCDNPSAAAFRQSLPLDSDTTVLLINTEGDTDPHHFAEIVKSGP